MSNSGSVAGGDAARRSSEGRIGWLFDPKLVSVALASVAVVVVAGLVQISFGAYSMTVGEAWRAVLDPAVLLDPAGC